MFCSVTKSARVMDFLVTYRSVHTFWFAACCFFWRKSSIEDVALCAGVLDPVTLEPVVNPAMSPAGGYACSCLDGGD